MKIPLWLQSSADEEKLALTIKGVLVNVVPIVLLVSNVAGWHLTQTGLDTAIDGILTALSALATLVGTTMMLAGMVRKALSNMKTPPNNQPPSAPAV